MTPFHLLVEAASIVSNQNSNNDKSQDPKRATAALISPNTSFTHNNHKTNNMPIANNNNNNITIVNHHYYYCPAPSLPLPLPIQSTSHIESTIAPTTSPFLVHTPTHSFSVLTLTDSTTTAATNTIINATTPSTVSEKQTGTTKTKSKTKKDIQEEELMKRVTAKVMSFLKPKKKEPSTSLPSAAASQQPNSKQPPPLPPISQTQSKNLCDSDFSSPYHSTASTASASKLIRGQHYQPRKTLPLSRIYVPSKPRRNNTADNNSEDDEDDDTLKAVKQLTFHEFKALYRKHKRSLNVKEEEEEVEEQEVKQGGPTSRADKQQEDNSVEDDCVAIEFETTKKSHHSMGHKRKHPRMERSERESIAVNGYPSLSVNHQYHHLQIQKQQQPPQQPPQWQYMSTSVSSPFHSHMQQPIDNMMLYPSSIPSTALQPSMPLKVEEKEKKEELNCKEQVAAPIVFAAPLSLPAIPSFESLCNAKIGAIKRLSESTKALILMKLKHEIIPKIFQTTTTITTANTEDVERHDAVIQAIQDNHDMFLLKESISWSDSCGGGGDGDSAVGGNDTATLTTAMTITTTKLIRHERNEAEGLLLTGLIIEYLRRYPSKLQVETSPEIHEQCFYEMDPVLYETASKKLPQARFHILVNIWRMFIIMIHIMKISPERKKGSLLIAVNLLVCAEIGLTPSSSPTLLTSYALEVFEAVSGIKRQVRKNRKKKSDAYIAAANPVTTEDIHVVEVSL